MEKTIKGIGRCVFDVVAGALFFELCFYVFTFLYMEYRPLTSFLLRVLIVLTVVLIVWLRLWKNTAFLIGALCAFYFWGPGKITGKHILYFREARRSFYHCHVLKEKEFCRQEGKTENIQQGLQLSFLPFKKFFRLGEPIRVELFIKNISDKKIIALDPDARCTPNPLTIEAEIDRPWRVFWWRRVVLESEYPCSYEGMSYEDNIIELEPGEIFSFERKFDNWKLGDASPGYAYRWELSYGGGGTMMEGVLEKFFEFPGTYTVRFRYTSKISRCWLHDINSSIPIFKGVLLSNKALIRIGEKPQGPKTMYWGKQDAAIADHLNIQE